MPSCVLVCVADTHTRTQAPVAAGVVAANHKIHQVHLPCLGGGVQSASGSIGMVLFEVVKDGWAHVCWLRRLHSDCVDIIARA